MGIGCSLCDFFNTDFTLIQPSITLKKEFENSDSFYENDSPVIFNSVSENDTNYDESQHELLENLEQPKLL